MATYADLNTNMQSQAGVQLRTFDKTISIGVNSWVRVYGFDSAYGEWMFVNGYGYYGWAYVNQRYEYVNANNTLFNNYLDAGIYTGNIIRSQDVIDSISSVITRTVNLIEGRMTNRSWTVSPCHQSCHSSCHTSRGRR
tara:strand:- start:14014 stop:14427 length:414 start_codon:yes stop_codon:yes gene_type:complete